MSSNPDGFFGACLASLQSIRWHADQIYDHINTLKKIAGVSLESLTKSRRLLEEAEFGLRKQVERLTKKKANNDPS